MIASQESLRINLLAIYNLLPFFTGELIQKTFAELGRLTFSLLESFLHSKLISGDADFCSPTKVTHTHILSTKVKINMMEKVSMRMETIKKEDPLLVIDIIDFFWAKMDETQKALSIQPNLLVLSQFLSDQSYKDIYTHLITANTGRQ